MANRNIIKQNNMSNKALYIIVAVLILLGIGLYVYNTRETQAPEVENTQSSTAPSNETTDNSTPATNTSPQTTPPTSPTGGTFSGEGDIMGKVYEVKYDGTAFSPKTLTVKVGDTVVFKNNSTSAFWPASAPHPTHTNYPEFDPKKAIAAGSSWSFVFAKVGTWPYHNHLNATQFGTITVTQ
jgi:plastocyanin